MRQASQITHARPGHAVSTACRRLFASAASLKVAASAQSASFFPKLMTPKSEFARVWEGGQSHSSEQACTWQVLYEQADGKDDEGKLEQHS